MGGDKVDRMHMEDDDARERSEQPENPQGANRRSSKEKQGEEVPDQGAGPGTGGAGPGTGGAGTAGGDVGGGGMSDGGGSTGDAGGASYGGGTGNT